MLVYLVHLAALSVLAGATATNQNFIISGEMNISLCPITYYGQKYDKVYVAFNSSKITVCFNGLYTPGVKNDCILMSGGTADRGDLETLTKEIPTGSGVHQLLPNLRYAGKCVNVIPLKDSQLSDIEQIELGNFGSQAILGFRTYSGYTHVDVETHAQVDGLTVFKQIFQTNETKAGVITDVSGCRLSGVVYKTNTTVKDPNTCSTVTCDVTGVAAAVNDCGPMESCDGKGSCIFNNICTVVGSKVLDFVGRVNSIPDRCGYNLLSSPAIPGLQVLGVFQERRRKDVSFLDRVILQLDQQGSEISLSQGRVMLDNKVIQLGVESELVHGVELSRDKNGVTAKISSSNYTLSVIFDSSVTLIHMTGPNGVEVSGLCGNSTVSQEVASGHSVAGCEIQYQEPADSTINCNDTTEWCEILKQAPFTACDMSIDPEPFITACTQTLCTYPAVDGLNCQFLEAYVRSCSYHSNTNVIGWKSESHCAAVQQDLCQNTFCSDHEFCGEKNNAGETGCLCRAIFASKYKPTDSFGEPTTCDQSTASVTMAACLLEDQGIDYSVLHLNDQACQGKMNQETHMVTFQFNNSDTCGTLITTNNSHIMYKNTIMTRNSSMFGIINRHGPVHIDFSCYYRQPEIKTIGIRIKDSSVTQQIVSGGWMYNLTMQAYTGVNHNKRLKNTDEISLNQKIWVDLETEGLDKKVFAVVTDSCWATNQPAPSGSLRYDLIINGCPNPADATVKLTGNGIGTSNTFSFNAFQFSGEGFVFLHCKVELCVKQGNSCIPSCKKGKRSPRSVRSLYEDKNPAIINLAWTY